MFFGSLGPQFYSYLQRTIRVESDISCQPPCVITDRADSRVLAVIPTPSLGSYPGGCSLYYYQYIRAVVVAVSVSVATDYYYSTPVTGRTRPTTTPGRSKRACESLAPGPDFSARVHVMTEIQRLVRVLLSILYGPLPRP